MVAQERVIVDLEKPEPEVFIDQEVIAEQLVAELPLLLVELRLDREDGVDCNVLHPWQEVVLDAHLQIWVFLVQELLEKLERHCVPLLV